MPGTARSLGAARLARQKGVGVVAGVVLVLAAVVPTHELDRPYARLGTFPGDPRQVREVVAALALGRVHLHLLPGVRLAAHAGGCEDPIQVRRRAR